MSSKASKPKRAVAYARRSSKHPQISIGRQMSVIRKYLIRLDSIFGYDISALPPDQQNAFQQAFSTNTTYTFAEFKAGVVTRLNNAFDAANVTPGNKAIKIKANGSRRSADVVACYKHRRYIRFISKDDYKFIPGDRPRQPRHVEGEIVDAPQIYIG
jgi:hypothetical protein